MHSVDVVARRRCSQMWNVHLKCPSKEKFGQIYPIRGVHLPHHEGPRLYFRPPLGRQPQGHHRYHRNRRLFRQIQNFPRQAHPKYQHLLEPIKLAISQSQISIQNWDLLMLHTSRLDLLTLDVLARTVMAGAGTVVTVGVIIWCLDFDPYKRKALTKLLPLSVMVAITLSKMSNSSYTDSRSFAITS